MNLGFATLGCPDWDLETIARNAVAMGFDGVELRVKSDGNHFDAKNREGFAGLKETFLQAGTRVFSLMVYSRFAAEDAAELQENQEELMRSIELAHALGAPFVRTFVGPIQGQDRGAVLKRAAEYMRPCIERAASYGIEACIETHDDWCDGGNVAALIDAIGLSSGLGVVWDISNAYWGSGRTPVEKTFESLKDYIRYCHVKDAVEDGDGIRYVDVGAGDVPLKDAFACLKSIGFDGWYSFEHEKKWHPELPDPESALPQFVKGVRELLP